MDAEDFALNAPFRCRGKHAQRFGENRQSDAVAGKNTKRTPLYAERVSFDVGCGQPMPPIHPCVFQKI